MNNENTWLIDLLQGEAREYIERREEENKKVNLMDFLADFTHKCLAERNDWK